MDVGGARVMLALQLDRIVELARARLAGPDGDAAAKLADNQAARAAGLADAERRGELVPGIELVSRFGLSAFELDALLLAAGVELDPRLRSLVEAAATRPRRALTVATALRLLVSSTAARLELAAAFSPSATLVRAGLLRAPRRPGLAGELIATRRAIAALRAVPLAEVQPPWVKLQPRLRRSLPLEADAVTTATAIAPPRGGLVLIVGAPGTGRTTFAAAVAGVLAETRVELDLSHASAMLDADELAAEVAEVVEDSILLGAPLVLDDAGATLGPGHPVVRALAEAIDRTGASVVVVAADSDRLDPALVDRAQLRVPLRGPRGDTAVAMWTAHAGAPPQGLALVGDDLALTPRRIAQAVQLSRQLGISASAALAALRGDAGTLLQTSHAQLSLAELVVADDTRAELVEVIDAIRTRQTVLDTWGMARRLSRGRGISALFDGEPGTGKTMAAEVIAREVELPLHRVNVSTLVDKYIGETEKNLARVFAEARGGSSIILFDEADALFGSRTDVKGSNDRYANLEINVLLQLMEEHSGIVLMTTNLKRSIDQAFLRRIAYKVQFGLPDERLRQRLWNGLIPANDRAADLDLPALARAFPLAGGDIKSAALRAAYRAAAAGRKVAMSDLVECAQLECQAMGRVVSWLDAR